MMKVAHHHALHAWMQSQNLCLVNSLVLGRQKNALLGDGNTGDTSLPLIDRNHLLPNGPYKCSIFAGLCLGPKHVTGRIGIHREVALSLVCYMGCVKKHVNEMNLIEKSRVPKN